MSRDYTLQINLSPGDVRYAELTVPALAHAHADAAERLVVVDVCKPQRTGIVDPEKRFPEPAYSERVHRIRDIADQLQQEGTVDRVEVLAPGAELFDLLSRKYLGGHVRETHDYGGCALMSYLAGFELCRTPWVTHFDADMLLHQSEGFNWVREAQLTIEDNPHIVAAIPRPCPPEHSDLPSANELLPHEKHAQGWLTTWFSTRCYLFDRRKLERELPLLQGRILWESRLARLLRRGYPRSPEIMLFRRMKAAGKRRLTLRDERAWLLHPVDKGDTFVSLLPAILDRVAAGNYPSAQAGQQDIRTDLWIKSPDASAENA